MLPEGFPFHQFDLYDVVFHQDNAPANRAASTMLDISLLGFEVLEHPPYSPDLAPMDFRVFPEMKACLRGRKFDSVQELRRATRDAIRSFSPDWYLATFNMWVYRHQNCVSISDYVEKVRRSLDLWMTLTLIHIWSPAMYVTWC